MRTVDTAVLAALEAVLSHVHDGEVPVDDSGKVVTSPVPYVVLYSDIGIPDVPRMSGRRSRIETTFQITYVGLSRDQAKWAGQRARQALSDRRLSPSFGLCRVVESQRVIRDRDAHLSDGSSLFYGVDLYTVTTSIVPASA